MCSNCPFRKEGAIELRPGRVEGIIAHLLGRDYNVFPCHKTTHGAAKEESACMGALAYMHHVHHMLPVAARFAIHTGDLSLSDLAKAAPLLRDPP